MFFLYCVSIVCSLVSIIKKSPQSGWLYVFSLFPPPPPPPPQWLLLLTSKPFELNFRYLGQRKYWSGKMHWMTFWWSWPKVTAVTLINKNFAKFSLKISDVFSQGQTLYWTYLRNGWSHWWEMKKRCIGWILGELCDIDPWPHPWPWPLIFKVKFQNSCISGIVIWLMWNKKKANQLDTGLSIWFCPLTTPMNLTL